MYVTATLERLFGAANVAVSGAFSFLRGPSPDLKIARKDLTMQANIALAVAGSVLAVPSAALAAVDNDRAPTATPCIRRAS